MSQLDSSLGKWIKGRFGSQVAFSEKMGIHPTRVSRWLKGQDGISTDYQDAIRGMGYEGSWPKEEAQDALAGGPAPYVTREEYGALNARIEALEKDLKEARNALTGATGAIRQLALKAGSPEIEALLR